MLKRRNTKSFIIKKNKYQNVYTPAGFKLLLVFKYKFGSVERSLSSMFTATHDLWDYWERRERSNVLRKAESKVSEPEPLLVLTPRTASSYTERRASAK